MSEDVPSTCGHCGQLAPSVQFLRVEEAARMLSVSAKTIQRHIQNGQLPAKRLRATTPGGRATILIDQRDILALLTDVRPDDGGG